MKRIRRHGREEDGKRRRKGIGLGLGLLDVVTWENTLPAIELARPPVLDATRPLDQLDSVPRQEAKISSSLRRNHQSRRGAGISDTQRKIPRQSKTVDGREREGRERRRT
jgi:hypothetical protein